MSTTTVRRDAGKRRYPDEVLTMVFDEVRLGKSLVDVCDENRNFPAAITIYRWMLADDSIRQRYLGALAAGEAAKTHTQESAT